MLAYMRRSMRRLIRNDRAQSIVEFALAMPFLILLVAGVIDFGLFMYDANIIGNAARAGVQYGSQDAISSADYLGMRNAATVEAGKIAVDTTATSCSCGGTTTASTCPPSPIYTCPADYIATFVQVTVSNHSALPALVSLPGLDVTTIKRTAVAQVSP